MKRHILSVAVILFLAGIFLVACGAKEKENEEIPWHGIAPGMEDLTDITERTECYDVTLEPEALFALGLEEKMPQKYQTAQTLISQGGTAWIPVGTQFFQGEPIQFWVEASPRGSDIYLYRKDGSRELLLEDFSNEYTISRQDCRIYLLLNDRTKDQADGNLLLSELDPATGEPVQQSERELPLEMGIHLGKTDSFPAVTGYNLGSERSISRVDMSDGSLLPILFFNGISYGWHDDLEYPCIGRHLMHGCRNSSTEKRR